MSPMNAESRETRKPKRYCKTLELKNDPELIQEYINAHAPEACWPEIAEGMREVGILDMQIYRDGTRLFMIMDTVPDFDHDRAMADLAGKPRQAEWEERMSRFQAASAGATAGEKWRLMDRIYNMEDSAGSAR
ncbi:MAG: L-rhamnose mutarotase [bacterium]|nr:L-rhamnose mutarotase [bacterium]